MKKQILNIGIVLTVLLATGGSAFAQSRPLPDSCTTSLLLAGIAGGLGLARKFVRKP